MSGTKIGALVAIWALSFIGGYWTLVHYHQTPSESVATAQHWTAEDLKLCPTAPTILIAIHPQCACTRASLRELQRILARYRCPTEVQALIYTPHDLNPAEMKSWEQSATMSELANIAKINCHRDPEGKTATELGMHTSGDIRIYHPNGRLLFHGGVTSARAHEGESLATAKVLAALRGELERPESHPVYGCSLKNVRNNE